MKKVYLELTNRCNLNCVMCYRKSWHEALKDMDPRLLNKVMIEIENNNNIKTVVLGGIGEPSYSKSIFDVLEKLGDKELIITTNGTMMSNDLIQAYIDHVDELVISVDGLSESFMKIRHFPLQTILNNIQKLNLEKAKRGSTTPRIAFQMVMSSDNYMEVPDLIDLAHENQVNKVVYSNILPASLEDEKLVMYKMYDKEPLRSSLIKASRKALPKGMEVVMPEIMLKTERHCRFIEDEATMVTVEGYVVPCYRFAHDGSEVVFGREKEIKAHHFGHIEVDTLDNIWASAAYVNYRYTVANNLYPSCMDCDLVDGCDMVKKAEMDCFGNVPSCADCLWSRKIVYCI